MMSVNKSVEISLDLTIVAAPLALHSLQMKELVVVKLVIYHVSIYTATVPC